MRQGVALTRYENTRKEAAHPRPNTDGGLTLTAVLADRTGAMQDHGYGLPRRLLPRTRVNKGKKEGRSPSEARTPAWWFSLSGVLAPATSSRFLGGENYLHRVRVCGVSEPPGRGKPALARHYPLLASFNGTYITLPPRPCSNFGEFTFHALGWIDWQHLQVLTPNRFCGPTNLAPLRPARPGTPAGWASCPINASSSADEDLERQHAEHAERDDDGDEAVRGLRSSVGQEFGKDHPRHRPSRKPEPVGQ